LSLLLSGSAQYIDGFLISYNFNEASFAVFKYGAKELPFIGMLIVAFSNALTPKFSKPENRLMAINELKAGTNKLMNYMFPLSIVFVLSSKYLYPIVFNENFAESAIIFNIYILLVITRFLLPRTILIGIKDTRPIFYSSLFEIILNVLLSVIFIQLWGMIGVAIATVIAYLFDKLFLVFVLAIKIT
jgi:O-antigen/teichoic acid export membrane protein